MNIFILHRSDEEVCKKRIAELSQFGDVILCSDKDEIKNGFKNICGVMYFPEITSWDTAFSRLSDDVRDSWFLENDVRWGTSALAELFSLSSRDEELITCYCDTQEEQPNWYWWKEFAHYFQKPTKSFNPVCRLRESLVRKVLEFRDQNEGFVFHELLFPSLAASTFDLKCTKLIGSAFRYRPKISLEEMQNDSWLYHPVKDDG